MYVPADRQFTIAGLPPGSYRLAFVTGKDWNGRSFSEPNSPILFGDVLRFKESKTDEGVRYQEKTVTLHTTLDGNVQPVPLRDGEFRAFLEH